MSNGFKGFDDIFWHSAIDTFRITFPSIGDAPDGMTAFQQRLALMMIDKLEQNMRGFYPSISRVLLACVGPHEHKAGQKNRTAFNILKDAVYSELQQLPRLAKEKPDKVSDFLPDNVTYDAAKNQLTHTYRDGAQIVTDLNTIDVKPVSLVAPDVRTPT